MVNVLQRSLDNSDFIRSVSGADVTVSLGTGVRAAFQTPTLGDLISSSYETAGGAYSVVDDERRAEISRQNFERQKRIRSIEGALQYEANDTTRAAYLSELDRLQKEGPAQIEAITQQAVSDGRLEAPEALTEKYGELGLQFDRPITEEQAAALADGKRAEIIREALMEKSPSGVLPSIAKFGGSLAAMAVDPVEIAATFIPVVGQSTKARAIGSLGRVGGRAAVGAAEGAIGQALLEPLYYGLSQQQQLDYTMSQALMNVGFGFLFGGAVGTAAGVLTRADAPPRVRETLDVEFEKEIASVSFRQFANDGAVDLSRFLDGRDLRSSTTLSRVDGIEFQARSFLPPSQTVEYRPQFLDTAEDGSVVLFDTVQKADRASNKLGGDVIAYQGGYALRRTADGDFVRKPDGNLLNFETERSAAKFIERARNMPETARPVQLGPREFAISRDLSDAEIRSITSSPETAKIPQGLNTREVAVLPDADARISDAVRGVVARREVASEVASKSSEVASDITADVEASRSAQAIKFDDTDLTDDLTALEDAVKQLDEAGALDAQAKADFEELAKFDEKAQAYEEVANAAALCLMRS